MNYTMLRIDRARDGGGTLIYISKSLKFVKLELPITLPHELEITVLRVSYLGMKPMLYVLVYNPPSHSVVKFLDIFRSVILHL